MVAASNSRHALPVAPRATQGPSVEGICFQPFPPVCVQCGASGEVVILAIGNAIAAGNARFRYCRLHTIAPDEGAVIQAFEIHRHSHISGDTLGVSFAKQLCVRLTSDDILRLDALVSAMGDADLPHGRAQAIRPLIRRGVAKAPWARPRPDSWPILAGESAATTRATAISGMVQP